MSQASTSSNVPRDATVADIAAPAGSTLAPSAVIPSPSTATALASCTGAKGTQIQIGYEPNLSYLANERGGPTTRFQALLQETFPSPEYQLVYKSYFREDLPGSVANGQLDFAVLELDPQSSISSRGLIGIPGQPTGVKVVTVPAGYSVVAGMNRPESAVLGQSAPWVGLSLSLMCAVVVSVFFLSVVAYVLNLRPPSPERWSRSVVTLVDPTLSRWTRAYNWMFTTTAGALVTGIWCLAGVCLFFLFSSGRAYASPPGPESDVLAKIDSNLSPKREIYEFRSNTWVKCRRTETCLRDYANEELRALLLGDRDTLCWHARQMSLEPPLEFLPDVIIPHLHAIVLPDSSLQQGLQSCVVTKLEAALAKWPLADRPTATCPKAAGSP